MLGKKELLDKIHHQLIVSCQALSGEPLCSPFIMERMALAAQEGGAGGIRANSPADIAGIRRSVNLPLIGLYKAEYEDSPVYITPTMKEVRELMAVHPDILALDATRRLRPGGVSLEEFVRRIRRDYPGQLIMADTSCYEEGVRAQELGFDLIGTTLSGYTEYTRDVKLPNFVLIQEYAENLRTPIIAEGGIWTPDQLQRIMETGVWAAVIGTAITRPREITRRFTKSIRELHL